LRSPSLTAFLNDDAHTLSQWRIIMKKHLTVVRNVLAASAFALVGLGFTPSRSAAAVNKGDIIVCIDDGECAACTDFVCIAACCGDCSVIIVVC